MASDIYDYEVMIGARKITACACDSKEAFEEYGLYESDAEGGEQLSPDDARMVLEKIRKGEAKLTYLGGWCSDGTTWGTDDVRHNYHEELRRFHDSLEE